MNRDCVSLYSFSWDGGSVQNDLTFGRLDFFSLELSRGAFGEQDVTSVVVDMELLVRGFFFAMIELLVREFAMW